MKRCSVTSIAPLQLVGGRVDEVGEDPALRSLSDIGGVLGREQGDHRAARLLDDLLDQFERVVGGQAETDESNVRVLACSDRADRCDIDLAGDHLVPESDDDLGEQLEPVAPLVHDQNAQVLNRVPIHTLHRIGSRCHETDFRGREAALPGSFPARRGPEVDPAIGGVAVDLRQFVVRQVESLERGDIRLELLDARSADQR